MRPAGGSSCWSRRTRCCAARPDTVPREPAGKGPYPLVSELAADGIPVAVTCPVLKLARQPYYRRVADPIRPAEIEQAPRANALFDGHRDDPEFG